MSTPTLARLLPNRKIFPTRMFSSLTLSPSTECGSIRLTVMLGCAASQRTTENRRHRRVRDRVIRRPRAAGDRCAEAAHLDARLAGERAADADVDLRHDVGCKSLVLR